MRPTEELRFTATKLVNAGKFVVDFALTQVGLQVYDIVKGRELKSRSTSDLCNDKKKNVVVVEDEMQANLEKLNKTKITQLQQSRRKGDDELKRLFDEPLNNAGPQRKVFIRSRL